MKIAVFTDVFLPKVDGIVTSLEQLVLELDKRGHSVLVVAPDSDGVPESIGGKVQLCYVRSFPSMVYPGIRIGLPSLKLRKTVKTFNPDLFLIITPITVGDMGLRLAKSMKKPSVGIFHTYVMKPEYLKVVGIQRGTKQVEDLVWIFMRKFFDRCTVIISPSQEVKNDMIKHGLQKPIVFCNNGLKVNTQLTKEVSVNLKKFVEERKLRTEKLVLYIGRVSKEKNLEMLLRVFKNVVEKDSDAQLLIIGGGPTLEELQEYSQELQLEKYVFFLGEINHNNLLNQQLFRLGRVFCTCSTSEVQPMSMIEAMLFGLPLIVPAVPTMRELMNENGFLIDPPDSEERFSAKILEIINDDALHKKLSQASVQNAQKFRIEETAQEYLAVFNQAIKEYSL